MSIQGKKKCALFHELLAEIHRFTRPDEKYTPPGKLREYKSFGRGSYDYDELKVTCGALETDFYCFVNSWKRDDVHVTIAIQDSRHPSKKGIAHFDMRDHNATQVVFYAALQYQLRETERRSAFCRKLVSFMNDLKDNRPEAYASIKALNKKDAS